MTRDRNATTEDDERWLAALAGNDDGATPAATALEARLLRQAIRRLPQRAAEPWSAEHERALLAAIDAEAARGWRCAGCARRWQALRGWLQGRWLAPAVGAGALAGLLAALLPLQAPAPGGDDTALRDGGPLAVRVLLVADPEASRDRLAGELAAHGARVQRYERLGRFGLDAEWRTTPPTATARAALAETGLALPADGIVRVEFGARLP